eukprot:TRINITY_DN22417_c0_g2_i1.p1 TRINITY_DN22417_c0_g2~~TRINITY_DN22417_c0_g2_i1.p1  ORF type:complete len:987 (+),score=208.12 TRINITY_DN22417_c0_g2_i1:115-3075(+)
MANGVASEERRTQPEAVAGNTRPSESNRRGSDGGGHGSVHGGSQAGSARDAILHSPTPTKSGGYALQPLASGSPAAGSPSEKARGSNARGRAASVASSDLGMSRSFEAGKAKKEPKQCVRVDPAQYEPSLLKAITSFPLLCEMANCSRCALRVKNANLSITDAEKRVLENRTEADEEVSLNEFSDGVCTQQEIIDIAENTSHDLDYNRLKLRSLLGLGPRPPRHRSAVAVANLDKVKFIQDPQHILSEYDAKALAKKLLEIAMAKAKLEHIGSGDVDPADVIVSLSEMQTALGAVGLADKVPPNMTLRVVSRLQRFAALVQAKLPREVANLETTSRSFLGSFRGSIGTGSSVSVASSGSSSRPRTTSTLRTRCRNSEVFSLDTWFRACMHAVMPIEGLPVAQGEDKAWTFVIYDELDDEWPWEAEEAARRQEEMPQVDLAGKRRLFKGLFIGVTKKPLRIGPWEPATSLSGFHLQQGYTLHGGFKLGEKLPESATLAELRAARLAIPHDFGENQDPFSFVQDTWTREDQPRNSRCLKRFQTFNDRTGPRLRSKEGSGEIDYGVADEHKPIQSTKSAGHVPSGKSSRMRLGRAAVVDVRERFPTGSHIQYYHKHLNVRTGMTLPWTPGVVVGHTDDDNLLVLRHHDKQGVEPQEVNPGFCRRPLGFVKLRVDRRPAEEKHMLTVDQDETEMFYKSKLWMAVKGQKARVLIEHMSLSEKEIVYPAVYGSRPTGDILSSVLARDCGDTWAVGAKLLDFEEDVIHVMVERLRQECGEKMMQMALHDRFLDCLGKMWEYSEIIPPKDLKALGDQVWQLFWDLALRSFQRKHNVSASDFSRALKALKHVVLMKGGLDVCYDHMLTMSKRMTKNPELRAVVKKAFLTFCSDIQGEHPSQVLLETAEEIFDFFDMQGMGAHTGNGLIDIEEWEYLGKVKPESLTDELKLHDHIREVVEGMEDFNTRMNNAYKFQRTTSRARHHKTWAGNKTEHD